MVRSASIAIAGVALLSASASAQDEHLKKSAAADCAALAAAVIAEVHITQAAAIAANDQPTAEVRVAHCRVSGVIGKETQFLLLLPDDWNRRFFMGGGGGFVGSVQNMAQSSINSGYATVGTDAGHQANGLTAGWARHNEERQVNFGYLAVHRTAEVAKELIRAYYGSSPVKSYFFGCSNGGRQGLMEAQRFPADFDGIVSIAPASDFAGIAVSFLRNLKAQYPTGDFSKPAISPDNLKLLQSKVLEACDRRDGVVDSVLDDPRSCHFKVSTIAACANNVAAPDCLTRAQRAAIEQIYAPLSLNGRTVYPGQTLGNEAEPGGWQPWITGVEASALASTANRAPTIQGAFGTEFFKYLVFGDSTWDYTRYDLSHWEKDAKHATALLSATNPDLHSFKARGGRLILAHGWSDPALNALATIAYYDSVRARDAGAASFVRLYMMPGVLHCEGGPGCDTVDWYTPIAEWVERGKAPETLLAAKEKPSRTRPLCRYPQHAVYGGAGSTDDAKSFVCK